MALLKPNVGNEVHVESRTVMAEFGLLSETQRKFLGILLKKSTHSNVDSALKFFNLPLNYVAETMGMKQSHADPCVFCKLDEKHELASIMSATVDNCAVTGIKLDMHYLKTELKKRFKITNGGLLKKHIVVDYDKGIQSDGKAC